MSMDDLDQALAMQIIASVGGAGQPPEYGFQYFSVGLEDITKVIDEFYLNRLIKSGGSSFKLIVGNYGMGKTHLLYTLRELAWKNNYATSYVPLSPEQTPFYKLDSVYNSLVQNLQPPLTSQEVLSGTERGIRNLLVRWYNTLHERYRKIGYEDFEERRKFIEEEINGSINGFESSSYTNAIRHSLKALLADDMSVAEEIEAWLKGESYSRQLNEYGILQKIDASTAMARIRSLGQCVRAMGYSGIVILFDETELHSSLSSRQKVLVLNNLRQLIDECFKTYFKGFMIFYTVPDLEWLFESKERYPALNQRLSTIFRKPNTLGVQIRLEDYFGHSPAEMEKHYIKIGRKLAQIYSVAYDFEFDGKVETGITLLAKRASRDAFRQNVKREYVQNVINILEYIRESPDIVIDEKTIKDYFK